LNHKFTNQHKPGLDSRLSSSRPRPIPRPWQARQTFRCTKPRPRPRPKPRPNQTWHSNSITSVYCNV